MFSKDNAYYYEQPETQLFERELPYKSIKLPVKIRERDEKILRYTQKKYEVEQLRMQILDRCKFQELEYLELLKRQREVMEEDIKRRKKEMEIHNLEEKITLNKKQKQREGGKEKPKPKVKDSLDQLQNQHEAYKPRSKTQRAQSAYSSSNSSMNGTQIMSARAKQPSLQAIEELRPINIQRQLQKDDQIKKLKQEMLDKYKFMGEAGKKPQKPAELLKSTEVQWWIQKVKKHRQQQAKQQKKKKQIETVYSDTNSDDSNQ